MCDSPLPAAGDDQGSCDCGLAVAHSGDLAELLHLFDQIALRKYDLNRASRSDLCNERWRLVVD